MKGLSRCKDARRRVSRRATRTTWRITSLSEGRLQIQAEEATGKTNSGGEREPPLRFHHPREFFCPWPAKQFPGWHGTSSSRQSRLRLPTALGSRGGWEYQ